MNIYFIFMYLTYTHLEMGIIYAQKIVSINDGKNNKFEAMS